MQLYDVWFMPTKEGYEKDYRIIKIYEALEIERAYDYVSSLKQASSRSLFGEFDIRLHTATTYKAQHKLYNYIPREWSEIDKWWKYITWLLFSNEQDGLFGEYTGAWSEQHAVGQIVGTDPDVTAKIFVPTFWIAIKWWARNPFSNVMKYALQWRGKYSYIVWLWTPATGWYFHSRFVVTPFPFGNCRQFVCASFPGCLQYRGKSIEWYAGWFKAETYKLGFAARKLSAKSS